MAECLVFQVILLREGLAIFTQYEPIGSSGGGSVFLFAGTGQEPRCAVGDVATSLMRHPEYAGCKLLGSMRRDRVDEAWARCAAPTSRTRGTSTPASPAGASPRPRCCRRGGSSWPTSGGFCRSAPKDGGQGHEFPITLFVFFVVESLLLPLW
ncbi:hypothetical protein ARSEF4850_005186 [Beauveria asiatica]